MKTIKLAAFGIIVNLTADGGGGSITSDLHVAYEDRDSPYNSAMDGIESMILGHAVAGVEVDSPQYLEGIETAVEGCANHMD